jgi:hypothetical protein
MPSSSASASSSRRVAAALVLLLTACGGGGRFPPAPPDAAPEVLPARPCTLALPSCPAPPPSYVEDIESLVARRCRPACHEPGGVEAAQPLTTYAEIYARRAKVIDQVFHCKMPPLDRPGLPDDEALTILSWLVCAAPNN